MSIKESLAALKQGIPVIPSGLFAFSEKILVCPLKEVSFVFSRVLLLLNWDPTY